jgi:hypothetical protein
LIACVCANGEGVALAFAVLVARAVTASLGASKDPRSLGVAVRRSALLACDKLAGHGAARLELGAAQPRWLGYDVGTQFHLLLAERWVKGVVPTAWDEAFTLSDCAYTRSAPALTVLGVARALHVSPFTLLLRDLSPSPGTRDQPGGDIFAAAAATTPPPPGDPPPPHPDLEAALA